ncbi:hypothetical protein [Acidovorax sp. NCPPB 4044]|uniref:hypothetical protein n=1 Tax=Acidovorax sp. NCPPB 4044 TaxID=2940490 RepID=UPI0023035888|nr:hypothetical protein [Acidovorax sp. NCPPB 4044]MDA8522006.1 hypothetical protein [Acidovorax sp. NCPPB 4044]
MKDELEAVATLAAVALQKRVMAGEDITEQVMADALLAAARAIQAAKKEWMRSTPPRLY